MIPIYRYSRDGFASKVQTYHMRNLLAWFEPIDYKGLNDYQRGLAKKAEEEARPLLAKLKLQDWLEGVFVFVGGLPAPHWIDHELNHLKVAEINSRSLFEIKISPEAEIYSVYGLIPEMYTVEEYLEKYFVGAAAFVPKRSLELIEDKK